MNLKVKGFRGFERDEKRWKTTISEDGDYHIVGKHGNICRYADGDLDVWVTNVRVANRLEKIWKAKQHYDDGAFFIRPYSDLNYAAKVIRARKKRTVSPEQRKRLIEMGRQNRFLAKRDGVKGVEND